MATRDYNFVTGVTAAAEPTASTPTVSTDLTTKDYVDTLSGGKIDESVMTTAGDMIYASAPSTPARLAIGSSGQVLKTVGGVPTWSTFSGGINYMSSNPDAEADASGWTEYDDAAATPVDLTGGTVGDLMTRYTTNPLRGTASFLFTHGNQGEGAAFTITPDRADIKNGSVLEFSFEYEVLTANIADGDYTVWIYDVANSALIQPTPYKIPSGVSGTAYKWKGNFQLPTNATTLRIAIHQAGASVTGDLKLENFACGPQIKSYGPYISDWTSTTCTLSDTTNTANRTFYSRRVGDSLELTGTWTYSAGGAGSNLTVTIPSGYTIDTAKMPSTSGIGYYGSAAWYDASATKTYTLTPVYTSTTTFQFGEDSTVNGLWDGTQAAASDSVGFFIRVPIVGWSSGQLLSSDSGDSRVVAYAMERTNAVSVADNTATKMTFTSSNSVLDTHAGVGTDRYTIQVPGYYEILGKVRYNLASNTTVGTFIYVDGVAVGQGSYVQAASVGNGTTCVDTLPIRWLNAGQYVELYGYQQDNTGSASLNTASYSLSIKRLSGPSQIAASETVACTYTTAGGDSIANNTITFLDFETKKFDTHGAVSGAGSNPVTTTNTGWKYVAPMAGKYRVSANVFLATGGGWAAAEDLDIGVYVDGTAMQWFPVYSQATHTTFMSANISHTVNLTAGQRIEIVCYQLSGAAINVYSSASGLYSSVSIERVGI